MAPGFITTKKFLTPLIALVVVAFAWFAWSLFPPNLAENQETASKSEKRFRQNTYFGPRNCLAVLPFADGSGGEDQVYLSQGFSAELIKLFSLSPVRVTARSSSFYFSDPGGDPAVIAERLQCAHLMTGEFQAYDGQVAVTVRLADARRGRELWSRGFEGELDQVFAIQEEIVGEALSALGIDRPNTATPSVRVDTRAWTHYLLGSHYLAQPVAENLSLAIDAFQSVLEIEPNYEAAWIGLAQSWLAYPGSAEGGTAGSEQNPAEKAEEALEMALAANPGSSQAHGLISYIRHQVDWDWPASLEAAQRAIELNPGDASLMSQASLALFTLGQFEESQELLAAAVERDPLNLASRLRLGLVQEFAGNYEQSLSSYRQIIGLNSEFPAAHAYRARVKIIQGKPESALKESEQEVHPFWRTYSRILALSALDRQEEAKTLLDQLMEDSGDEAAFQVAEVLSFQGDVERAFEWFERAYDQKDGGMAEIIGNQFLVNLHDDPRWEEMLEHLGLPLDWGTESH